MNEFISTTGAMLCKSNEGYEIVYKGSVVGFERIKGVALMKGLDKELLQELLQKSNNVVFLKKVA